MIFPPTTNAQEWRESVELIDDDTGLPFDLTGYTVEIELRTPNNALLLYGSTGTGAITITSEGFNILFPEATMRELPAAGYIVYCRAVTPTGEILQLDITKLNVLEGGFK